MAMPKYRILSNLGEGSYAKVFKCEKLSDGLFCACKQLEKSYNNSDQIPTIPEIQVLRQLDKHPNIIELYEIIYTKRTGSVCLIFELMDMNLYEFIKDRTSPLPRNVVCRCIYSILIALEYIHKRDLIHRDVKPENILIKGEIFKLSDFGMCRSISNQRPITDYVATRWYRAPECILTNGYYGQPMDIWSIGCVMFEIITGKPLFKGSSDLDQINKIHTVFGTPSIETLKKFQEHQHPTISLNFPTQRGTGFIQDLTSCSVDTVDLLIQMCSYDADNRISAFNALAHPYFNLIRDRNLEIDIPNSISKNKIPLIETNDDMLIKKRLSPIQEESILSISPKAKQHSSMEILWEKLLISVPMCAKLIERLSMPSCKIGLTEYINYVSAKSISNQAWETMTVAHAVMTKIETNLEFNLVHLKTAVKVLIKAPTWQLKQQLFRKALHNLKTDGANCIGLINQIKDKCADVKKQIKELISTVIDRLEVENAKHIRFSERTLTHSASSSIHKAISIIIKIAEIVVLGGTISYPMIRKSVEENLIDNHLTNSDYVEEHNQVMELVNYLMLFEQHLDKLILFFSFVTLRFNFTLIEQTLLEDSSNMTLTEQVFVIELMKPELSQAYEELCALLIIFHVYLDVSDKFCIQKLDDFLLIQSHENDTEDSILINNWVKQTSSIQIQVKQLIQESQMKYISIFQQQQIEFKNFLNELSKTV